MNDTFLAVAKTNESVPYTNLPFKKVATKHDRITGRDPERVKIFDTTLRDGEQSPGCTMTIDEKMKVAEQLHRLGVDVIEAGFPSSSDAEFDAVMSIAKMTGNAQNPPIICGLSRAIKKEIEICWKAVKAAEFPRIHIFLATSDIHMENKLKKSRAEILEMTKNSVSFARSFCEDVEFTAEDALRSDPDFLQQVYTLASEAGATTLNVADTVGYAMPSEMFMLVYRLRQNIKEIDSGKVILSAHTHNDLGLAVANLLSAVQGGARQVECTINGIGERAGNAALEEVVMALEVRKPLHNSHFGRGSEVERPLTNIKVNEIYNTSFLVSNVTGMMVQPNKAIVGKNAFLHEAGVHQDGILKNRSTYEIMDPVSLGLPETKVVLGKHSGRAAFRSRLNHLGFGSLPDEKVEKFFQRFKQVTYTKKKVTDADIFDLIHESSQVT